MDDDIEILNQLRNRDIRAFKRVCCDHSENMTALAFSVLQDMRKANQVVDEVLFKLWNETDLSMVTVPFQQFLNVQVLKSCGTETGTVVKE
jgi:hypothetical protein